MGESGKTTTAVVTSILTLPDYLFEFTLYLQGCFKTFQSKVLSSLYNIFISLAVAVVVTEVSIVFYCT